MKKQKKQAMRVGDSLDSWLGNCPDSDFPESEGQVYKARYRDIAAYLSKHIHPEVEKGAMYAALKEALDEGKCSADQIPYLNAHGVKHISTVIRRASELLEKSECEITPYEAYLLLVAIQFHDVGNIFGRPEHERKCREIMNTLGVTAGVDEAEKRQILGIAGVHSGLCGDGDKDTISLLVKTTDLMGQTIRPRLLAAILRFADELADDSTRVSAPVIDLGIIPAESLIYHCYSQCLHSVVIEKAKLRLSYEIGEDIAVRQFPKNQKDVFLLDEIYMRTLKAHCELLYCMRFMRPLFQIESLKVSIRIYQDRSYLDPIPITYNLEETGYPAFTKNIYQIIPKLNEFTGERIKDRILSGRRP